MESEREEPEFETLPDVIQVDHVHVTKFPERVQQVLCLMACGFSPASVARLAKVTPSAIHQLLDRYDPKREFTLTVKERKRFLAQLWEARAGEALLHITPDKLELSSASELANIASRATTQMRAIAPAEKPDEKKPQDVLAELGIIEGEAGGDPGFDSRGIPE